MPRRGIDIPDNDPNRKPLEPVITPDRRKIPLKPVGPEIDIPLTPKREKSPTEVPVPAFRD